MTGSGAASGRRGPLVLVVMDGWGLREQREGNAIRLARTPNYLELLDRFPHSSLQASGEEVGLPAGQMGNSEVGHITMGAGRIVYQDLTRIDKSVRDGDFFEKPAFVEAMTRCSGDAHALHLIGLVSPNGIHSHTRHLSALVEMAARLKVRRLFVQAFTDGRDTSPAGGAGFVGDLERVMAKHGSGRVASVGGRYYGMDRDNRWERTKRAYDAIAGVEPGETGPLQATSAVEFIRKSYQSGCQRRVRRAGHHRRRQRPADRAGPRRRQRHLFQFPIGSREATHASADLRRLHWLRAASARSRVDDHDDAVPIAPSHFPWPSRRSR